VTIEEGNSIGPTQLTICKPAAVRKLNLVIIVRKTHWTALLPAFLLIAWSTGLRKEKCMPDEMIAPSIHPSSFLDDEEDDQSSSKKRRLHLSTFVK
jgi:hypothetical protein